MHRQPHTPPSSPRGFRVGRLAALAVLAVISLTGCSTQQFEDNVRLGFPRGITQQADRVRVLWTWSAVTALAVGVVVWGLIFWSIIVYRRRKGTPLEDLPRQVKYNLPIEWVYTVIPFFIIGALFFYTVRVQNFVVAESSNPAAVIQVDAFKWNWKFEYRTYQGQQSVYPNTTTSVNTVGTSDQVPVLLIPVNQRVRFVEHSFDVVHSFWVPEFLFKRDVVPHGTSNTSQDNTFEITPTTEGSYVGRCSEFCGMFHSQMNFEVRVVPGDVYQRYLQELARLGPADPNRQAKALTAVGLAPYATTTHPFNTSREYRQASGTQVGG